MSTIQPYLSAAPTTSDINVPPGQDTGQTTVGSQIQVQPEPPQVQPRTSDIFDTIRQTYQKFGQRLETSLPAPINPLINNEITSDGLHIQQGYSQVAQQGGSNGASPNDRPSSGAGTNVVPAPNGGNVVQPWQVPNDSITQTGPNGIPIGNEFTPPDGKDPAGLAAENEQNVPPQGGNPGGVPNSPPPNGQYVPPPGGNSGGVPDVPRPPNGTGAGGLAPPNGQNGTAENDFKFNYHKPVTVVDNYQYNVRPFVYVNYQAPLYEHNQPHPIVINTNSVITVNSNTEWKSGAVTTPQHNYTPAQLEFINWYKNNNY